MLPALTKYVLTDVCCASDGDVYICGQQGTILRGRRDHWSLLPFENFPPMDFWSLTFFAGYLYVASMHALFRLEGDVFVPVDTDPDPAQTFGHLRHIEEVMWSTGAEDLMPFDGQTWTRLA